MNSLHAHLTRRTFLGGAVAFGAVGLIAPKVAFAEPETSSDVQAKADAARQKLDEMRLQLGVASDTYNQALEDHDTALSKMDEAQTKIDENNVRIAELQERLGGRARSMYRNGQTTFLDIVLGSASFDDFLKNWDSLNMLNDEDAKLVSETKALREDNEAQKAEYSTQADTAKQKMDEAQAAKAEAESLVGQYQDEVDSLDAEVAALLEEEKKAAEEAAAQAAEATGTGASSSSESSQDSSSDDAGGQGGESDGSTGGGSTGGGADGGSNGGRFDRRLGWRLHGRFDRRFHGRFDRRLCRRVYGGLYGWLRRRLHGRLDRKRRRRKLVWLRHCRRSPKPAWRAVCLGRNNAGRRPRLLGPYQLLLAGGRGNLDWSQHHGAIRFGAMGRLGWTGAAWRRFVYERPCRHCGKLGRIQLHPRSSAGGSSLL